MQHLKEIIALILLAVVLDRFVNGPNASLFIGWFNLIAFAYIALMFYFLSTTDLKKSVKYYIYSMMIFCIMGLNIYFFILN